jgi:hypothetical protein
MLGFVCVSSSKNCSSVGLNIAGACTSAVAGTVSQAQRSLLVTIPRCRMCHTFADTLHRAHLSSIFHRMDAEVDLNSGLLLLDGPNSVIDLLVTELIRTPMMGRASIHPGESSRSYKLGSAKV